MNKIAQFGGVGGQSSPFAPGGSPMFRGQPSFNGNGGINNFSKDVSLDGLMGRTRNPHVLGIEQPFEQMLEIFHDGFESDAEQYLLDPSERQKLKRKKLIRKKEEWLKKLNEPVEDQLEDETPKVKQKFKTVESLLDSMRKNQDIDFAKNANRIASMESLMKNQHKNGPDSYYRTQTSLPTVDNNLATVDEYNADGNPLNLTKNRFTEPFTGQDPHYTKEDGLDKYIDQLNSKKLVNMHMPFEGLMNYEDPAESTNYSVDGFMDDEGSNITPESLDNGITLEQKLEKLKKNLKNKKFVQPGGIDWDKKLHGDWPNRSTSNPFIVGDNDTLGTNPYPTLLQTYPIAGIL